MCVVCGCGMATEMMYPIYINCGATWLPSTSILYKRICQSEYCAWLLKRTLIQEFAQKSGVVPNEEELVLALWNKYGAP